MRYERKQHHTTIRIRVIGTIVRRILAPCGIIILAGCASTSGEGFLKIPASSAMEAQRHMNEGVREFNTGSWAKAQRHLEQAVEADPKIPQTHYNLGLVLYRLGKGVAAEQHFIEASRLAPEDRVITNFRALYDTHELSRTPTREPTRGGSSGGGKSSDGHGGHSH